MKTNQAGQGIAEILVALTILIVGVAMVSSISQRIFGGKGFFRAESDVIIQRSEISRRIDCQRSLFPTVGAPPCDDTWTPMTLVDDQNRPFLMADGSTNLNGWRMEATCNVAGLILVRGTKLDSSGNIIKDPLTRQPLYRRDVFTENEQLCGTKDTTRFAPNQVRLQVQENLVRNIPGMGPVNCPIFNATVTNAFAFEYTATIICPANHIAVGGGADCTGPTGVGVLTENTTNTTGNAWNVKCCVLEPAPFPFAPAASVTQATAWCVKP